MLRTAVHTGLMVLAIFAFPAQAAGPSEKCRDGASQCREAFKKLEQCESDARKPAPKKDGEETKTEGEAEKKPAETCTAERSATDSACKTTNTACVKDGSRHAPHARKD